MWQQLFSHLVLHTLVFSGPVPQFHLFTVNRARENRKERCMSATGGTIKTFLIWHGCCQAVLSGTCSKAAPSVQETRHPELLPLLLTHSAWSIDIQRWEGLSSFNHHDINTLCIFRRMLMWNNQQEKPLSAVQKLLVQSQADVDDHSLFNVSLTWAFSLCLQMMRFCFVREGKRFFLGLQKDQMSQYPQQHAHEARTLLEIWSYLSFLP